MPTTRRQLPTVGRVHCSHRCEGYRKLTYSEIDLHGPRSTRHPLRLTILGVPQPPTSPDHESQQAAPTRPGPRSLVPRSRKAATSRQ